MDFSLVHHVNWFKACGQNTSKDVNKVQQIPQGFPLALRRVSRMNAVDAGDEFLRFGSGCFGIDFFRCGILWLQLRSRFEKPDMSANFHQAVSLNTMYANSGDDSGSSMYLIDSHCISFLLAPRLGISRWIFRFGQNYIYHPLSNLNPQNHTSRFGILVVKTESRFHVRWSIDDDRWNDGQMVCRAPLFQESPEPRECRESQNGESRIRVTRVTGRLSGCFRGISNTTFFRKRTMHVTPPWNWFGCSKLLDGLAGNQTWQPKNKKNFHRHMMITNYKRSFNEGFPSRCYWLPKGSIWSQMCW